MSLVSLYDEASLWMTPSGVKDGKLYSELPVPKYGPEKVTNGTFNSDLSGWVINNANAANTVEWSAGQAHLKRTASAATELRQSTLTTGKKYYVNVNVNNVGDATGAALEYNGSSRFIFNQGVNSFEFTASTTLFSFICLSNTTEYYIDNVSIKEVLSSDGDFTFSRGSNLAATRVGADGLIEKGRENLLKQSNQFGTTWTNYLSTETSGQIGYDGSNNAWLLTKSGASGQIRQNVTSSGVATFSVYAKANASDYTQIVCGSVYQFFNLSLGTLAAGNGIGASIEAIGNGWHRCSVSLNSSITSVKIYPAENNSAGATSGSIYIQDAQLEIGLAATDYIESGASTGKAGVLEDEPRFDYSGGASCPSLLLEPSRTNGITQSEYIGATEWVNAGATRDITITQTSEVNPEGGAICWKIESLNSSNQLAYFHNVTNGTTYTNSIYVKRVSGTGNVKIRDVNNTHQNYTLSVADGWKRIHITGTATSTNGRFYLNLEDTGDEILVWGAQQEAGSYATSYIPTYGSSVTRGADTTATLDLSPIGLNGEDVTHFIDFKNNQFIARDNGGTTFRFNSNTANHGSLRIYRSSSSAKHLTITLQDNNGNFSNPGGYEMTSLNPKVAIKRVWATGEIKAFVDGKNVLEGTSTLYNSWNKIDMEGTGSTAEVKQLISFPIALTDSECVELTINGIKEDLITAYKKRATTLEEGASERLDTYLQSLEDFIII